IPCRGRCTRWRVRRPRHLSRPGDLRRNRDRQASGTWLSSNVFDLYCLASQSPRQAFCSFETCPAAGFAPFHLLESKGALMKITWFGHSAFRLDFAGRAVLIDPFFTGNPGFEGNREKIVEGVSHILLTHGHGDHVGDTVDIAKATGAKVVANFELCMYLAKQGLENFDAMNTGGTTDQGGFTVTLVRADHSSGLVETDVNCPLGSANGIIVK